MKSSADGAEFAGLRSGSVKSSLAGLSLSRALTSKLSGKIGCVQNPGNRCRALAVPLAEPLLSHDVKSTCRYLGVTLFRNPRVRYRLNPVNNQSTASSLINLKPQPEPQPQPQPHPHPPSHYSVSPLPPTPTPSPSSTISTQIILTSAPHLNTRHYLSHAVSRDLTPALPLRNCPLSSLLLLARFAEILLPTVSIYLP
ncbi:hypothetical protein PAAG_12515 [Paracoccidioides lutzii Pb01]|uniref:Uncharacterized protein n=1 Tax=Paracoccidioides lutzii (strain ATCC MYA-826 / Pb01) TaxID=502779 RepID=A0A0A2V3U3_PARBA|nr:hypothetical protein PAAG_12515 [Paracoccidioides lutzii Pb01]KGQ00820.1 hypothetical protein PAAG_12515 [Paracoccidioides lutzii Pb01]